METETKEQAQERILSFPIVGEGNVFAITYTCKRDLLKAWIMHSTLPKDWFKIWVVSESDSEMPIPFGVRRVVKKFNRGHGLNLPESVLAMKELYVEIAKEMTDSDLLVKIDSDTVLYRPDAFTAPFRAGSVDFTYIRRHFNEGRLLCNGCCYAVNKRALERLGRVSDKVWNEVFSKFKGEDMVFSAIWNVYNTDLMTCQINKKMGYLCCEPYHDKKMIFGHYGYMTATKMFGEVEYAEKLTENKFNFDELLENIETLRAYLK